MSMHKIPLSNLEKSGLAAHGLPSGQPSQLSDAFRQGVAWALEHTDKEGCKHDWVSADNEVVTGGVICTKCKAIKAT